MGPLVGEHAAAAAPPNVDMAPGTIIRVRLLIAEPLIAEPLLMIRLADGWYSLPGYVTVWRVGDPPLSFSDLEVLLGGIRDD